MSMLVLKLHPRTTVHVQGTCWCLVLIAHLVLLRTEHLRCRSLLLLSMSAIVRRLDRSHRRAWMLLEAFGVGYIFTHTAHHLDMLHVASLTTAKDI